LSLFVALVFLAIAPRSNAQANHDEAGEHAAPVEKIKANYTPRFLYVAAPADLGANTAAARRAFKQPLHVGDRPLAADSRYVDFFTIDAELLGKEPRVDPDDPTLLHVDHPIPADAIVSVTHFWQRPDSDHVEMDRVVNDNWLEHLPDGKYPRVPYSNRRSYGGYDVRRAHVQGPKLMLNRDMMWLHAVSTDPNELFVDVHANENGVSISDENGEQEYLWLPELGRLIREEIRRRRLPRTIPIRLGGCLSGHSVEGDRTIAQRLADELVTDENPEGNTVIAPIGVTYHEAYPTTFRGRDAVVSHPPVVSPPPFEFEQTEGQPRWRTFRSERARPRTVRMTTTFAENAEAAAPARTVSDRLANARRAQRTAQRNGRQLPRPQRAPSNQRRH
jgi:hypothetical protein